jgi:Ser/Thr protein kinase RdoA (MazF antagonist)
VRVVSGRGSGEKAPEAAGAVAAGRPREIALRFELPGPLREIAPFGSGHIHETFVARCAEARGGASARVVLQRINTRVFRDPEALMGNLARIAAHLYQRLHQRGTPEPERRVLVPLRTREGALLLRDEAGGAWRAFPFLEGTRSCDAVESPAQAWEGARAFGAYAALLADLPPPPLVETIADFHHLPRRRAALVEAARRDPHGRGSEAAGAFSRCESAFARLEAELLRAGAERLPRRTLHNDCKLNNVLFDSESGEGLCVIDLDTTMPGTILCDFGELVRTAASPAAEDEARPARVALDLELFSALARGYLAGAGELLAPEELRALPLAGPALALENAIRFLTDHLEGDLYFRIHRPGHNLDRCLSQLRRVDLLLEAEGELRRRVREAARP